MLIITKSILRKVLGRKMEDNNYGRPTRTRKKRYNVKRIVALLIILVAIIAAFVMLIKWIVSEGKKMAGIQGSDAF